MRNRNKGLPPPAPVMIVPAVCFPEKLPQICKPKERGTECLSTVIFYYLSNRLRVAAPRTLPESGFLLSLFHFAALEVVSSGMKILMRESSRKGSKLIRNSEFRICFQNLKYSTLGSD